MRINRVALLVAVTVTLWIGFSHSLLYADTIVLPNINTAVEGNSGQNTAIQSAPRTLQTVFAASQLVSVLGMEIVGLAFRLDGGLATFPTLPLIFAAFDIQLSMSLNAPGSLSTSFANNIGPDVVTVRSGPLTIPPGAFPGGSTPNVFGLEIVFTAPYLYLGGDLLITIRHTGNGAATQFLDSQTNSLINQSIAAASYTATMAQPGLTGTSPVTRLTTNGAPIPEPSTILLVGLGGVSLIARAARRKIQRKP